MVKRIVGVINRATVVFGYAAGAAVIGSMLIILYEVFIRYAIKGSSLLMSVPSYFMVAVAFLGVALGLQRKTHVKIEMLETRLNATWRARLGFVASLLTLAFAGVFTWQAWQLVQSAWKGGWRASEVLDWPLMWPMSLLLIGGLLLCFQILANIYGSRRHR